VEICYGKLPLSCIPVVIIFVEFSLAPPSAGYLNLQYSSTVYQMRSTERPRECLNITFLSLSVESIRLISSNLPTIPQIFFFLGFFFRDTIKLQPRASKSHVHHV
jgi:hypothetical protein